MTSGIDPIEAELDALDRDGGSRAGSRRSSTLVPIAIALFAIAAFAGVVWYAYSTGIREGSEFAAPLLKTEGPSKVAPESPGGQVIPHQDKLVYGQLQGESQPPRVEQLLPPPEEPLPLPAVRVPPPAGQQAETAASSASGEQVADTVAPGSVGNSGGAERPGLPPPPPPPSITGANEVPALQQAAPIVVAPAPVAPVQAPEPPPTARPAVDPAPPTADASSSPAAQPRAPEPPPAPDPAPRTAAPPAAASPTPTSPTRTSPATTPPASGPTDPPPPSPKVAPAGAGSYRIQLASLRSTDAAAQAWEAARAANADILGSLRVRVEDVTIAGKGTFYRVQAGTFASGEAAEEACRQLKARKVDCLVVRP